jgi:hypothetical protein
MRLLMALVLVLVACRVGPGDGWDAEPDGDTGELETVSCPQEDYEPVLDLIIPRDTLDGLDVSGDAEDADLSDGYQARVIVGNLGGHCSGDEVRVTASDADGVFWSGESRIYGSGAGIDWATIARQNGATSLIAETGRTSFEMTYTVTGF